MADRHHCWACKSGPLVTVLMAESLNTITDEKKNDHFRNSGCHALAGKRGSQKEDRAGSPRAAGNDIPTGWSEDRESPGWSSRWLRNALPLLRPRGDTMG